MENRIGKTFWFDLPAKNAEDAMAFYEGLFGWSYARLRDKLIDDYWIIQVGQELIGGIRKTDKNHSDDASPIIYFTVSDLESYSKRVVELGGQLIGDRMDLGQDRGSYQWFKDREGNVLALWALK